MTREEYDAKRKALYGAGHLASCRVIAEGTVCDGTCGYYEHISSLMAQAIYLGLEAGRAGIIPIKKEPDLDAEPVRSPPGTYGVHERKYMVFLSVPVDLAFDPNVVIPTGKELDTILAENLIDLLDVNLLSPEGLAVFIDSHTLTGTSET